MVSKNLWFATLSESFIIEHTIINETDGVDFLIMIKFFVNYKILYFKLGLNFLGVRPRKI